MSLYYFARLFFLCKEIQKQLQNFDLTKENKKVINHILKENALNHAYVELYDQDEIYLWTNLH